VLFAVRRGDNALHLFKLAHVQRPELYLRDEARERIDVYALGREPTFRRPDDHRAAPTEWVEERWLKLQGVDERRRERFPVPEPPVQRLRRRAAPVDERR
jgi:hypothetical protein